MYYEIESLYEMPSVIFEDDRLIAGKKEYLYEKIGRIQITNSIAFATYAIFKLDYDGKTVNIPFNRHHLKTAKRAIREWEQRKKEPVKTSLPFEEIKQLKELLDMGAITQEEFDQKKKEYLDL